MRSQYTVVETPCGISLAPIKAYSATGAWIDCGQCDSIHWGEKTDKEL